MAAPQGWQGGGGSFPSHLKNKNEKEREKEKETKREKEKKNRKKEGKITKSRKLTKMMTIMTTQFTSGSKRMSF